MKFDAKSVALGFIIALLIVFVWRLISGRSSFFTNLPDFQETMTPDAAKAFYDATFQSLSADLEAKVKQAKELKNPDEELKVWKDGRNMLNEFSNKYDEYLLKKQKAQPTVAILHPNEAAPAAAPATVMMDTTISQTPASAAPSVAPATVMMDTMSQAPASAAPMVSTFEPEPYY